MAKSRKKIKKILKNNQSLSTTDQPSQQNQPYPYTIAKKSSSKLSIFYYLLAVTFFLLMFNSGMNHLMFSLALNSAFSQNYLYSHYIEHNMTILDTVFSAMFYCIIFSYVLVIWAFLDSCRHSCNSGYSWSWSSNNSLLDNIITWWMRLPFIAIIPLIFFGNFYHRNVEDLMYNNINKLYQKVSQDSAFEKTPMNAKFQKALQEKDYETLKELSSNINSLAKITPEQLSTVEEAVSKVPISKIRKDFETFRSGYTNYADYIDFYDKSQKLFQTSEYKTIPRHVSQMKKLKLTYYDYESIKTFTD